MTEDRANQILTEYSWAKWSDARELLQMAAHEGSVATKRDIVQWLQQRGFHDAAAELSLCY